MLKQRIITAFILIPLFLLILFYFPPKAFCLLTGLVILGAGWEWSRLSGMQSLLPRLTYLAVLLLSLMSVLFIPMPLVLLVTFAWWMVALVLVLLYPRGEAWLQKAVITRAVMGVFVLVPCWAAINVIRNDPMGIYALLYLLVLVFGSDSAAYFAGRYYGRHKLIPAVSPGKSWEGVLGAMVFSTIFVLAVLWKGGNTPLAIWPWVLGLSLTTVAASILGDLFESLIKRIAGVKDSGNGLPGHGGLCDRIDSLTAAAPVFALGAFLLGQIL